MQEVIDITTYKEGDRFKSLKSDIFKLAKNGKPFEIATDATSNEYRYFHKLYVLYLQVISKQITNEQAQEQDRINYSEFVSDQRIWENYHFSIIEWNDNIKRSEILRSDLQKSQDRDKILLILAEIVERLTKDCTILPFIQRVVEDKP